MNGEGGARAPFPLAARHQWWCAVAALADAMVDPRVANVGSCSCLPAWRRYEQIRLAGMVLPRELPTAIVEGPPCLACQGTAVLYTSEGAERLDCMTPNGTMLPACRGNGGGRMSPAAAAAWTVAHPC